MRRIATLGMLAVLALASSACYDSVEPLSKPGERIDQALLGVWNCVAVDAKAGDDPLVVRIWRWDDTQYYVETVEEVDHVDRYRIYPSRIGARTLLNVHDLEEKKAEDHWNFLRYAMDGKDKFAFWVIPEEALKGVQPGQAMATIRKRAAEDAFYKKVGDCRRQ